MGDLDGVGIGGDQAGIDQICEHRAGEGGPTVLGVGEFGEGDPPPGIRGALAEGDQPQQYALQGSAVRGVEPVVDVVGGLSDGTVDSPGGPVSGHGQPPAVPIAPGLLQSVAEQCQPASRVGVLPVATARRGVSSASPADVASRCEWRPMSASKTSTKAASATRPAVAAGSRWPRVAQPRRWGRLAPDGAAGAVPIRDRRCCGRRSRPVSRSPPGLAPPRIHLPTDRDRRHR